MIAKQLAAGVALLTALGAVSAQKPRTVTVQVLAINDFHGNLEPPAGADGRVNQVPAGGVEYLATHIHKAFQDNPNSIFVAAGDFMGASPILSSLFHDSPTVEAMNQLNMSVSALGNHELDHGSADLFARIKGGCLQKEGCSGDEKAVPVKFQYLAANVITDSGKTLFPASAIRTVGSVKIGFIGVTLRGMVSMIGPTAARGMRFLDESSTANAAAAQLEKEGVHTIVLLIHEGGRQRQDSTPEGGEGNAPRQVDPNGCVEFGGAIAGIAKKLSPSIRVVISGHTHAFYNCEIAGHIVTSAGSFGRLFTRVNLTIDSTTDRIVNATARNEIVTRDVSKDDAMTAILTRYRPAAARLADRPVGSVTEEMTRIANAVGESAVGDLVADADLESVRASENGGAVIAFENSGGIRSNLTGHGGANGPRTLSWADLYAVQPFGNRLTVISMTGDMIRRLLEQQFRGSGRPNILQVSGGFGYQYRANAPAGEHIVPGSITLNGRPIGAAETVRVEALDFLVTGGGGFSVFAEGKDPVTGPIDVDALVEYVAKHSPIAPTARNRVVRVD